MTVGINEYLYLSAVLFAIGFFGVLLRKNTLVIYMCLELMLVASTVALVAFSRFNRTMDGNVFVFFILTVAAAEVAVGLAIIVALFRRRQTIQVCAPGVSTPTCSTPLPLSQSFSFRLVWIRPSSAVA